MDDLVRVEELQRLQTLEGEEEGGGKPFIVLYIMYVFIFIIICNHVSVTIILFLICHFSVFEFKLKERESLYFQLRQRLCIFTSRHTAAIWASSMQVSVTTSVNEPPARYSITTHSSSPTR